MQDVQRAKDLVGQTALLEFQLLETEEERNRLLQRINALTAPAADTTAATEDAEEEKSLFEEGVDASDDGGSERSLISLLAPLANGDVAVSARDLPRVKSILRSSLAQTAIPKDVEFLFSSKGEGVAGNEYYNLYLVRARPEMTGDLLQEAFVSMGQSVENLGQPIVNFSTTDEGVRQFARITGAHVGERMAIVLDEAVYSAPTIQTKINEGRGMAAV